MTTGSGYRFMYEFTLGDRLRKSLQVHDIGVQEIAARMHVSRNTVSNWINGRVTPSSRQLMAWAAATGAPLEWLSTGAVPNRGVAQG